MAKFKIEESHLLDEDYKYARVFLSNYFKRVMYVATASMDNIHTCYQVMDDVGDFFDWYCEKYPYQQFYDTPFLAVFNYMKHYHEWIKLGCPKGFAE